MQQFVGVVFVCTVIVLVAVPAIAQDFPGAVVVDESSFTATYEITLPGVNRTHVPIPVPSIRFGWGNQPSPLSFTPGSVTFAGQPVDFSGTEADFLASSYDGTVIIENNPNATVPAVGVIRTGGPIGEMPGLVSIPGLDTGPLWADSFFDVFVSQSGPTLTEMLHWNSAVVPELNGALVTVVNDETVTNVDPVLGIVETSGTGEIRARAPVETFTFTGVYNVSLPGVVVDDDVNLAGDLTVTSLDFTPGSVTFEGQPVDFDGTEASFLANSYNGSLRLWNAPNQTVLGVGGASTSGPGGNMNSESKAAAVNLGPGFTAGQLDIQSGSTFSFKEFISSWTSPAVPELNSYPAFVTGTSQITAIDAINGTVNVSGAGSIFGLPIVPTLSQWGLILLALGLTGIAVLRLRRRVPVH